MTKGDRMTNPAEESGKYAQLEQRIGSIERNVSTLTDGKWQWRKDIPALLGILRDVGFIAGLGLVGLQQINVL